VILLLESDGTSYIGPIFFGLWVAVIALFVFVVIPKSDRKRIREHIDSHGGKVIEILSDWFGAGGRSAKAYDVTYISRTGQRVIAKCITSMTSGVQWLSDRPLESDMEPAEVADESGPPESSGLSEPIDCIECGAKMLGEKMRCPQCGWSYQETKFTGR
jgi:hypothetical protein